MRAWVISDIHTGSRYWHGGNATLPKADVCICAGDTSGHIESSIDYLGEIARAMPVVSVLGNHDYYGNTIDRALTISRDRSEGTDLHILEDDMIILDDVRFIGSTLWTDFDIPHGRMPELPLDIRRIQAFKACTRDVADFSQIFSSNILREEDVRFITVDEMIKRHEASVAYIERELSAPFQGRTVVLSHHAPSAQSLHPAYAGSATNAAFASDLTETIQKGNPDFWIHGHVHYHSDYQEGDTRILCNPFGYRHERHFTGFKPNFIIDI